MKAAAAIVFAAALLCAAAAEAQPWPAKPVKVIVAFPPGGGNDFIARFIAARLSASLGQQFVVENRAGAGGTIGFETGIRAAPDGYTLTLISNSYTVNPSIYKIRFDPVADMTPVIQISQGPYIVVVHPSVPARNFDEFLNLLRARGDSINFASSGTGSVAHLATELLASMGGFKLNHVPYRGTGPALADTIGGQTNAMLGSPSTTLPHVRAGRLRALAVTTSRRLVAEPEVPTVAEAGVPGYEAVLWHALIGPKGLPQSIVARLNLEITTILKLKEAAEQLQNDGVSPAGGSPEDLREAIRKEIELWRRVVNAAGVKIE